MHPPDTAKVTQFRLPIDAHTAPDRILVESFLWLQQDGGVEQGGGVAPLDVDDLDPAVLGRFVDFAETLFGEILDRCNDVPDRLTTLA
mgnify:CR=1 FL=1